MNPLLWTLVGLLLLVVALSFALSFYMTRRHSLQEIHTPSEFSLDYEEISLHTSDGLTLCAWWIPSPGSTRAVIIMHGHGGSMDYDVHRAVSLHQAGFSVLLFDFRAHGRSQGWLASFGYYERRDVQAAVSFLSAQGVERIGLLGFSYGGIAAMLSAPLCPEVAAVISDGGPVRIRSAIGGYCLQRDLPRWLCRLLAWQVWSATSLRLGVNLSRYEAVRWVGKISPRPILFIHGDQDPYLPDFDDLYAAAQPPREVWRVPEAGHVTLSRDVPEEHSRRILDFFLRHL